MERTFAGLGAVFALVAVALGAFGAHGLRPTLSAVDMGHADAARGNFSDIKHVRPHRVRWK